MKAITLVLAAIAVSGCVSTNRIDISETESYIKAAAEFHSKHPEYREFAEIKFYNNYKTTSEYSSVIKKKYITSSYNELMYRPSLTKYAYGEILDKVRNTTTGYVTVGDVTIWCDGSGYAVSPGKHIVLSSGLVKYRVNSKIGKTTGSVIRAYNTDVVSMKYGLVPKYFKGVDEAVFSMDGYSRVAIASIKPKELGNFVAGLPSGKCEPMKRAYANYTPVKLFTEEEYNKLIAEHDRLNKELRSLINKQ